MTDENGKAIGVTTDTDAQNTMRLQKFLARAGVAGRRRSEAFIAEGRVTVNGAVVTEMGVKVNPELDVVLLDGNRVVLQRAHATILMNKPEGCYSTMHEQEGRSCVADFLPVEEHPGLYHIGRLDRDTTGALLFSTDGDLGHALLHPSHHVDKTYLAQVEGRPTQKDLDKIRAGIVIRSGDATHQCAPAQVDILKKLPNVYRQQDSCLEPGLPGTTIVRITIHEGVKHQVKLMFGAIGHPVVRLHRASFGPVQLGALKKGEWRYLDESEVCALREG